MAQITLINATGPGALVIPSLTIQAASIALLYGSSTATAVILTTGETYTSSQDASALAGTLSFSDIKPYGSIILFNSNQLTLPTGWTAYAPSVVYVYKNGSNRAVVVTDYYQTTSTETLANLKSGVGAGALLNETFAKVNNTTNTFEYWYNPNKCTIEPSTTAVVKFLKPLGSIVPITCVSNSYTYLMTNNFTVTSGTNNINTIVFTDLGTLTLNLAQSNTSGIKAAITALLAANQRTGSLSVLNPAAGTFSRRITNTTSRPATASVKNNGTDTTKNFVKQ